MTRCWNCVAREKGFSDSRTMFRTMLETMTPKEIAKKMGVHYRTLILQMNKVGLMLWNTHGGKNVMGEDGKFRRITLDE